MDMRPLIDALRDDLGTVAEAGSAEIAEATNRLSAALEPAIRMTLIDALGAAAREVAGQLEGVQVDVRMRGRDADLVVTRASSDQPVGAEEGPVAGDEAGAQAGSSDVGEGVSRVSLRLPETLKNRAERAAASAGMSVNAWLVQAVAHELDGPRSALGPVVKRSSSVGGRLSGWAR